MVAHYRVNQGKFYQTIIAQGKDNVIQGKFNMGRYKYQDKITLGRITLAKINQDTITQSMDKFTQGKVTHIKDTYGKLAQAKFTHGKCIWSNIVQ